MADNQQPKSALNKTSQKAANHVVFGDTPAVAGNPKPPAMPTPPAQVTVAPPTISGFQLKDEVELLRDGFKNNHGEQVKTQGEKQPGGTAGGQTAGGAAAKPPPSKDVEIVFP